MFVWRFWSLFGGFEGLDGGFGGLFGGFGFFLGLGEVLGRKIGIKNY